MNQLNYLIGALLMLCIASAGWSENHLLQPDFTFKRITVPPASATNRITVQIDPDAAPLDFLPSERTPPVIETGADVPPAAPSPSGYEWYWDVVPAGIEDVGPGRFQLAVSHLDNAPTGSAVPAPRLQKLQDIASTHGRSILVETVGTPISPALVLAVIAVESAGQDDAVSSAGAQGLMQLMPDTATRFGVSDSFDPARNISGGVAYLTWLFERYDNDPVLALAGYNSGEGNVDKHAGVPPFAETRGYVPKVLAAWRVAIGLCATQPELITDACVFNVNQG